MSGKRYLYPNDFTECDICHGRGKIGCRSCYGKGYFEETVSRYDSSGQYYSNKEQRQCTTCHGSGEEDCYQCGGTGDKPVYNKTIPIEPSRGPETISPRTKEEYKELYETAVKEAEEERMKVDSWLSEQYEFEWNYKIRFLKWLREIRLDHPAAEEEIKATAISLDQPYLSIKAGTLASMLRSLASLCGSIQMYDMMSK